MTITIIATGKLTERFWREACDEYLKRLRPYARVQVVEIADAPDDLGVDAALTREGEAILKAIPAGSLAVLLDRLGIAQTSVQRAQWLERLTVEGTSHLTFIIGGSNGVSTPVREECAQTISFGPITLPHNLARVVLLEQIYRSFKIVRGEPYHK
ncbi:MAG: 23S rRNA (pseudouridine(1915)-N(3))-methyltransferase RlmH [Coriobacteriia bacterium]|nr:23S rRNA (pseudouridine(1915)-N(3))-methyltransferase RlmH [Coriobacteriia bacterium]